MADKQPWFKFYPSDWRADQALRLCSAAARGLWVECMCLMHEAKPYGHLLVNGRRVTETQLANLTGIPHDQITELLGELENVGVSSKTSDGVIYSRRMTRDAKRAADGAKYGKRGGNPTLTHNPTLNPTLNPQDKARVAPEARSQNPDISKPKKEEINQVVLSASSNFKNKPTLSKQEIKARWQGKVCNYAATRMPDSKYAAFLAGWAADEPWAIKLANELDAEMRTAAQAASPQTRLDAR